MQDREIVPHAGEIDLRVSRHAQQTQQRQSAEAQNISPHSGGIVFHQDPGLYVLLKPFRAFVTVNVPSCCADTLIQYAGPLCTGGGADCVPGLGFTKGATGIEDGASSAVFAINIPATVYSCPLSWEKCSCHRSSSPGDE